MKKKIIANNPLSKNLARILGYYNHIDNPRWLRRAIKNKIDEAKNKHNLDKELQVNTIITWIEASDEDNTKSIKWPSLDMLIAFSNILGIDYLELFIPDDCIQIGKISSGKKKLIKFILGIEDSDIELIEGITDYIISTTNNKISETIKESLDKQKKYKCLLTLLEASN